MILRQFVGVTFACFLSLTVGTSSVLAGAFEPPPERNAPASTAGGGSRPTESSCTLDEASGLKATALAPQTFIGLTSQATPSLWIYLPNSEVSTIEVSVFDQQLNGLTQLEIDSPYTPGFLAIDLAEHMTLAADTPYYWTAAFVCTPSRRTEDWVVGGWIKHQPVSSDDQQVLQTLFPIDRVKQYMSTGYWYDAFTEMLPLIQANPSSSDFEVTWNSLIRQADLELTWIDVGNVIRISKQ